MWYDRDVLASAMVMMILQHIDVYYQYIAQLNLCNIVCISIICKIKNKNHKILSAYLPIINSWTVIDYLTLHYLKVCTVHFKN